MSLLADNDQWTMNGSGTVIGLLSAFMKIYIFYKLVQANECLAPSQIFIGSELLHESTFTVSPAAVNITASYCTGNSLQSSTAGVLSSFQIILLVCPLTPSFCTLKNALGGNTDLFISLSLSYMV